MQCPFCHSQAVVKNGKYSLRDSSQIQHHLCKTCAKRFSQKTGTPMAGLRTSTEIVAIALRMRGEGMGVRASSRVLDKSHSTILRWVSHCPMRRGAIPLQQSCLCQKHSSATHRGDEFGGTPLSLEKRKHFWIVLDSPLFQATTDTEYVQRRAV